MTSRVSSALGRISVFFPTKIRAIGKLRAEERWGRLEC